MKKRTLIFITAMIIIMILPINVDATKSNQFTDSIYTYNHFTKYKYETINNNLASDQRVKLFKQEYLDNKTCGGITNFTFNQKLPKLTSIFYNLLKVSIPVLLVVKGMIDLFKSMCAGKEDEMKKKQKKFINRLISALCAFIVFALVETVIGWIVPKTGNDNAMSCVNCFVNNKGCSEVINNNNSSESIVNNTDNNNNNLTTCKSGYKEFTKGKTTVCLQFQQPTGNLENNCSGDWTKTAQFAYCAKAYKPNSNNNKLSCNNGNCSLNSFNFTVTRTGKQGKCDKGTKISTNDASVCVY